MLDRRANVPSLSEVLSLSSYEDEDRGDTHEREDLRRGHDGRRVLVTRDPDSCLCLTELEQILQEGLKKIVHDDLPFR
jgi:hypoxanthine-guanine phosphoribosyltransferase